jgi:PTH2 family peptidyl-tRNA hydrolase
MTKEIRQTIIVRKDLNMRKGKMIAQGSHASNGFLTKIIRGERKLNDTEQEWLNGGHAKICLAATDEKHLEDLFNQAREAGLEVYMVIDSGKTEFKVPTKTCIAIGPDLKEKIDLITSSLQLL